MPRVITAATSVRAVVRATVARAWDQRHEAALDMQPVVVAIWVHATAVVLPHATLAAFRVLHRRVEAAAPTTAAAAHAAAAVIVARAAVALLTAVAALRVAAAAHTAAAAAEAQVAAVATVDRRVAVDVTDPSQ